MNITQNISQLVIHPLTGIAALVIATACVAPMLSHEVIDGSSTHITIVNGVLFSDQLSYSGHVLDHFANGTVKREATYHDGRLHGIARGWHENGQMDYARTYSNGVEEGTHLGWYENGSRRFEYHYANGVSQGVEQQWYPDGKPYTLFHYINGEESGQQQMWDSAGKLRANYVIRDGRRYGLPGAVGCRGAS